MSRRTVASFFTRAAASLLVAACLARAASAQAQGPQPLTRTQYGIGYVANAPDAMVGGAAYVLVPRAGGIGMYVDAKFDVSSPRGERGYDAGVTSKEVADRYRGTYIGTETSWRSVNAALMRPLTPSLLAYAGAGIAKTTPFDLFTVDENEPVGLAGVVWAENPETAENRLNLMAGVVMRLTSLVSAHFGYETQPSGLTVGASLRFPRW